MKSITLKNQKQNIKKNVIKTLPYHHPCAALFVLYIGMPVFIPIALFAATAAIMYPISWMMGWI